MEKNSARVEGLWELAWWVAVAVVLLVAIFVSTNVVLPCSPDLVNYTPTPTFQWDAVTDADLAGYKLYYRMVGGEYQLACDIPGETWRQEQEDGSFVERVMWKGVDLNVAIQRCLTGYELQELEIAVKAYDTAGNVSQDFSTCAIGGACVVCMPQIWPGGSAPYN